MPNPPNNTLTLGVVTTSFPVPSHPASGVFVERLVAHLPADIRVQVLIPCADVPISSDNPTAYQLNCFRYGPRTWQRLAHRPGGLPEAWRRRDPALLLLPLFLPALFIGCLRLAGQVDLLHGNWSLPSLIAAIAARLRGKPAIATLRGADINRAQDSWLFQIMLRACLAWNIKIVVVSQAMHQQLQNQFAHYAKKIAFIPNGVAVPDHCSRTQWHHPYRLVTVGSLIPRKRLETILNALAHSAAPQDSQLRIIGDGPDRRALEQLAAELGISARVDFVGSLAPEQVAAQLQWADTFVFASESEGRPNVILEAMAAGLPIMATDIPGVTELLEPDAGCLYPVGEVAALADGLAHLHANPAFALRLGSHARQRIEQSGLSWTAAGERYAELYRQALVEYGKN
ncbi:GDP-mannose-dependent alpha-(1-6)-phosphatidylinositol monomannoside mannosyltransferase [Thiorhodovibrio winogradskyi]|uniref:GDP-mannose-dependent alpha-(1-6)-phosphatidylinositol monomannoside mannosyltransferase n=1 Tax=Thiorhodovibrio winogradskyi TaxID=77007 RepID=A0ABZ0SDV4_9GAMM|nr:glycosyltransferase [Thiorhodovibrio winogradskyi]